MYLDTCCASLSRCILHAHSLRCCAATDFTGSSAAFSNNQALAGGGAGIFWLTLQPLMPYSPLSLSFTNNQASVYLALAWIERQRRTNRHNTATTKRRRRRS